MHSKAYRVYNKCTQLIEESIHIVFDESNDGNISSSPFQELKLSRYDDDHEEEEEEEARAKASKEHQETFHDLPPPNDELQSVNEEDPPSNTQNEDITHEQ